MNRILVLFSFRLFLVIRCTSSDVLKNIVFSVDYKAALEAFPLFGRSHRDLGFLLNLVHDAEPVNLHHLRLRFDDT